MRVAYICVYQGPELLAQRPITRGRSIAGSEKSRLVASAMALAGHDVYCIAEAIPTDRSNKFYPSFESTIVGFPAIKVVYASGFDSKIINNLWGRFSNYFRLWREHKRKPFSAVVIYDLSILQMFYVLYAHYILRIPVIIDYEDDGLVTLNGTITLFNKITGLGLKTIRSIVNGCLAISPQLFKQFPIECPQCLVRGIADSDLIERAHANNQKKKIVLYSGGLTSSKGVDVLLAAWEKAKRQEWSLHITGTGPLADRCEAAAKADVSIIFFGEVSREKYLNLLCEASICVNPNRITKKPGNIFPFKIVEYLASGAVVVSTRMCEFDSQMLPSMIFTDSDHCDDLSAGIAKAIDSPLITGGAQYAIAAYGLPAVSISIDALLQAAVDHYQASQRG